MQITLKSAVGVFRLGYRVDPEHREIFCAAPQTATPPGATPHGPRGDPQAPHDEDHPLYDAENWRAWDPLSEDTSLFRKFAVIGEQYRQCNWPAGMTRADYYEVEGGADMLRNIAPEIVAFAGKYGLPGDDVLWIHHYAMVMADGIDVMDAILTDDRATLMKYFEPEGPGWGNALTLFVSAADLSSSKPSPPGLVQFARVVLDDVIRAAPFPKISLEPGVAPSGEHVVCGLVTQFIHVVWLQFAAAYLGEKQYRECATCGSPFEISPDVHRTNRKFCSDTCRVKHYQRRKAKAIKLRAKGEKLRAIAKETGTDVEQVKKWVGES